MLVIPLSPLEHVRRLDRPGLCICNKKIMASTRFSCDRCHGQKLQCIRDTSSNVDCDRCVRANAVCAYSPPLRPGRPRKNTNQESSAQRILATNTDSVHLGGNNSRATAAQSTESRRKRQRVNRVESDLPIEEQQTDMGGQVEQETEIVAIRNELNEPNRCSQPGNQRIDEADIFDFDMFDFVDTSNLDLFGEGATLYPPTVEKPRKSLDHNCLAPEALESTWIQVLSRVQLQLSLFVRQEAKRLAQPPRRGLVTGYNDSLLKSKQNNSPSDIGFEEILHASEDLIRVFEHVSQRTLSKRKLMPKEACFENQNLISTSLGSSIENGGLSFSHRQDEITKFSLVIDSYMRLLQTYQQIFTSISLYVSNQRSGNSQPFIETLRGLSISIGSYSPAGSTMLHLRMVLPILSQNLQTMKQHVESIVIQNDPTVEINYLSCDPGSPVARLDFAQLALKEMKMQEQDLLENIAQLFDLLNQTV